MLFFYGGHLVMRSKRCAVQNEEITLTGLITQPAFIFWNTFEMTGAINYIPARLTYGTAFRVLSMCSCLHLMLVTAERLVAIKFTMHYRHFVTKENIRAAVICSWILSLFCDALRLIKVIEDRQALAFSLFVVSSCIVFVASGYAVLYVETRRHRKLIKIQQMPQEEAERFRKENKALKTTVYVVSALMLCFLPMALRLVIDLMKRPEIISSLWVRTFAMLNSLLNPLIYCCRQEEMRDFVFKTRRQAVQPH